ncbi:uncharacterized protein SCHCODRAFT_02055607 [Schizophyllum commune H4-8]|uniref:uncharacterized protein n=1 Tax=Schizophyllum commune (strain H4-8 / FGSC 9210) TaxID=578458 RepID=UPI00215ED4B7|nr:uncharacterized protein SCHCODRAFT_02055607 [Schizophyllum commune H4-8]KAI5888473.1 hypothetical protein SCHCODRAFT_02055607 [Schizophyllum commune H4-8]
MTQLMRTPSRAFGGPITSRALLRNAREPREPRSEAPPYCAAQASLPKLLSRSGSCPIPFGRALSLVRCAVRQCLASFGRCRLNPPLPAVDIGRCPPSMHILARPTYLIRAARIPHIFQSISFSRSPTFLSVKPLTKQEGSPGIPGFLFDVKVSLRTSTDTDHSGR